MKVIMRKTMGTAGALICICGAIVIITAVVCLLLHIRPAVVVSGSMEPAIHTGSILFVDTEYEVNKVVERDIIAFDMNGTMVTHRVKGLVDGGFITKGDANRSPDPAVVSNDSYLGRVIIWFPWVGYVCRAFSGTGVKILAAAAFVSIALLYSLLGKEGTDGTEEDTVAADNSAA